MPIVRVLVAVVTSLSLLVIPGRADGSPLSRARTRDGYALAYDLQFAACLAMLEKAAEADSLDPGPQRAIAAVTWMEMLFAQGVATLLMVIDNREGRPADAVRRLEYLRRQHPGNRLLTLNHGAAALAATQPLEAVRVLSEGLTNHASNEPPPVLGETALWLAHRGSALARLHRTDEAVLDLRRGLSSDPRDWVTPRWDSPSAAAIPRWSGT